jgi:hypothetical protein
MLETEEIPALKTRPAELRALMMFRSLSDEGKHLPWARVLWAKKMVNQVLDRSYQELYRFPRDCEEYASRYTVSGRGLAIRRRKF